MAYWIHENGETIGPLRAIEILERAQPDTLVSQGQEWVALSVHPDFGKTSASEMSANLRDGDKNKPGSAVTPTTPVHDEMENRPRNEEARYWVLPPRSKSPVGPFSHGEVLRRGTSGLQVSHGSIWVAFGKHPDFQQTRSDKLRWPNVTKMMKANPVIACGVLVAMAAMFGSLFLIARMQGEFKEQVASSTGSGEARLPIPASHLEALTDALSSYGAVLGHYSDLFGQLAIQPSLMDDQVWRRTFQDCVNEMSTVGQALTQQCKGKRGVVYEEIESSVQYWNSSARKMMVFIDNRDTEKLSSAYNDVQQGLALIQAANERVTVPLKEAGSSKVPRVPEFAGEWHMGNGMFGMFVLANTGTERWDNIKSLVTDSGLRIYLECNRSLDPGENTSILHSILLIPDPNDPWQFHDYPRGYVPNSILLNVEHNGRPVEINLTSVR